jgi:hypothetical protein
LDSYFLVRDKQLRRLDTDSWEQALPLPEGTVKGTPSLDLTAMEGRTHLTRSGQPAGILRASLRLEGLRLTIEKTQLTP